MESYLYYAAALFIGFFLGYAIAFKKYRQEKEKARRDYLTKVFNYRELSSRLNQFVYEQEPDMAFALLDLDNFKTINDSMGYEAGDQLLKQFVEFLVARIRAGDMLFRFKNGDEFMIVFRHLPSNHQGEVADRLQNALEQASFHLGENDFGLTMSVAITSLQPGDSQRSLLNRLELGLKKAKETRNRTWLV